MINRIGMGYNTVGFGLGKKAADAAQNAVKAIKGKGKKSEGTMSYETATKLSDAYRNHPLTSQQITEDCIKITGKPPVEEI